MFYDAGIWYVTFRIVYYGITLIIGCVENLFFKSYSAILQFSISVIIEFIYLAGKYDSVRNAFP